MAKDQSSFGPSELKPCSQIVETRVFYKKTRGFGMNLKFVLTIKKMAKIGRKVSNIRIRIRVRQMVRLDLYPNYILKIRIQNTVNILSFIKKYRNKEDPFMV